MKQNPDSISPDMLEQDEADDSSELPDPDAERPDQDSEALSPDIDVFEFMDEEDEEEDEDATPLIRKARFGTLSDETSSENEGQQLDMLMDLPLVISIELGRTRIPAKEFLHLGVGSVVELDKLAGEPVDVIVNDRRFAHGEVVVIDENFGVRITRLCDNTSTSTE